MLPFATWSNTEHTGGKITICFCITAFPTGAPEWSEGLGMDGRRMTENEGLLDRNISAEIVTLAEREEREGCGEKEKKN